MAANENLVFEERLVGREDDLALDGDVRAVDAPAESDISEEPAAAVAHENAKATVTAAPAESAEEVVAPTAEMPLLEMRDVDSIQIGTELIRRDPGNIGELVRYIAAWGPPHPIHIAPDGCLLDGDSLRVLAAHKALKRKQIQCLVFSQ